MNEISNNGLATKKLFEETKAELLIKEFKEIDWKNYHQGSDPFKNSGLSHYGSGHL